MKTSTFKLNTLYAAVLLATTAGAQAQDANNVDGINSSAVEVIEVRGIRSSLTKSAEIKRHADGVVDAISAEDIGKLPDSNLAESLQRISGVAIDRSNNEGNQVTVRGFGPGFNMVTLNGRQMPNSSTLQTDGISRSFNFRELAAESVSGVNVYKTGRANVTSGGIGASIDIQTAKPFDYDGFKGFASAKAIHDSSVETGDNITPEMSGMVSNTFLDGTLGVLLSASHSERHNGSDLVGTDGWVRNRSADNVNKSAINTDKNPTQAIWTPWTARVEHSDTERERQNAQAVIQYQPMEGLTATLDYTISRFEQTTKTNRSAFWFDSPTGDADENGTLWNPTHANEELDFWAWEFYDKKENESIGVNLEWQATEALSFTVDYHDSSSTANPDGRTAETLSNVRNVADTVGFIGADFSGDTPIITVNDANLVGGAYSKQNLVSDLYQQRGYEMDNNVEQIQIAGAWENMGNDTTLTRINFGFSETEYQVNTSLNTVFSFVNVPLNDLDFSFEPLGDTANELSSADNLFSFLPRYDINQFVGIVKDQNAYTAPSAATNGVTEDTTAIFVSFEFDTEFNDMPVKANAGVRYESTDVSAFTVQEGITALNFRHGQELQPVKDGIQAAQSLDGNYDRILPNFDISLGVQEDLITRFSYSRTLSRAGLGSLFPGTNLLSPRPGGPFNASQGNPNLLPITADNFDFTVEWYLDDGSYASVGYFKKFVENFIGNGTENRVINNVNGDPLTDPSINPRAGCPDQSDTPNSACLGQASDPVVTWEVATPSNMQNNEVSGWEFNLQYMFADTGFGAIANYTIVDSNETFDPYDFDQTIALTGLGDSGNLVAFYEKEKLQVRLAYNWRDDFMQSLGNEPTFVEAYGQLDMNISYEVTDDLTVSFNGLNITNSTTRSYARFEEQLLKAQQFDPRYDIGVSFKF